MLPLQADCPGQGAHKNTIWCGLGVPSSVASVADAGQPDPSRPILCRRLCVSCPRIHPMFRASRALRPIRPAQCIQKRFLSIHEYRGAQLLKQVPDFTWLAADHVVWRRCPRRISRIHTRGGRSSCNEARYVQLISATAC